MSTNENENKKIDDEVEKEKKKDDQEEEVDEAIKEEVDEVEEVESNDSDDDDAKEGTEEEEKQNKKEKDKKKIVLHLGDIIQFEREVPMEGEEDKAKTKSKNTQPNRYLVDYIDHAKMKLIEITTLEPLILFIKKDDTLSDTTITGIILLSRNKYPGYARQHDLVPSTWINIYFGGDVPTVVVGEITNLEEDMIEIKTFPDKETIYINFEYKGIPEGLPIENIEIREAPESMRMVEPKGESEVEEKGEGEGEAGNKDETKRESSEETQQRQEDIGTSQEQEYIPLEEPSVKDNIRQFLLKADEIEFNDMEEFGPITQYIEVVSSKQRYGIDMQTNDLLNELLSTIPTQQRTPTMLTAVHTMIERFIQLRKKFSTFDQNQNIEGPIIKTAQWRPLIKELNEFERVLYWILPVVKNVKKIYGDFAQHSDTKIIDGQEDLMSLEQVFQNYKSNSFPDEQNKYSAIVQELNDFLTPFEQLDPENRKGIIADKQTKTNIQCIVDNLGDFYSSVISAETTTTNNKSKQKEDRKKFYFQKYNTGLDKLLASQFSGGKMIAKRVPMTDADEMEIQSFLVLTDTIVQFSNINLPCTSILERSNLHSVFLNYWQLLRKNTDIEQVMLSKSDSNDKEKEQQDQNEKAEQKEDSKHSPFLSTIQHYIWENETPDYDAFLDKMVPKTKQLFKLFKKYINGAVSLVDAVKFLEPFLVYTDDLTYQQYNEINFFLREKISGFNKMFVERSRAFMSLKTIKLMPFGQQLNKTNSSFLTNLIQDAKTKEEVFEEGYETTERDSSYIFTPSEVLNKIMKKDAGKLFHSALALETSTLMLSGNLASLFEQERKNSGRDGDDGTCATYILAKQYTSEEDLEADNNKEIYFDKRFDKTRYSILDEPDFQTKMARMSSDEFVDYLVAQLQKKEKLNLEESMYLAETLITGAKKVQDGQYAFIFDIGNMDNLTYYKRIDGKWMKDDTVDKSFFVNDDTLLCNVQKNCIEVNNKCETTESNKHTLTQSSVDEIMKEFDEKYNLSKEEMEKKMQTAFQDNLENLTKLKTLESNALLKYNNSQFKLGMSVSDDDKVVITSPYNKLRDLILGQTDFVKRYHDIIKFTMEFTREAIDNIGRDETPHWRYCIKTGAKLLPSFIYTMASFFVNDPVNYNKKVGLLIKEIGVLSDDGDAHVDEHSGYVIKKRDFDNEEGFTEEGRKMQSREILEQDAANLVKAPKFDTPEIKMASNVLNTFEHAMGLQLIEQREFILKQVHIAIEQALPNEAAYKKEVQEIMKKGNKKTPPTYKELYNSTILYLTMGMMLIGIQASIPDVKTKKTFPGCVRSFTGFPMGGVGDDSAVIYFSCVARQIPHNSIEPWTVLIKKNETFIADRMKDYIQRYYLNNPEITRKFEEKTEYLLTNPVKDIPVEHAVSSWKQFLPPLLPFTLTNVANITTEFKSKLLKDLRSGYKGQQESLQVVESKIILFSLRVQEKIQKIVEKQRALLTNMANEAFLENGCCNDGNFSTTLEYFIEHDAEIGTCNQVVQELSNTMDDVRVLSKALMMFSEQNTKNIYPGVTGEFNEETIYKSFITFCNFNNAIPIHENLISLCSEKPEYLAPTDSIQEQIKKLKNDGKIYNNEMLLRLLQIVGRSKEVYITVDSPVVTQVQKIRDILESLNNSNDEVVDVSLRDLIDLNLDTYDLALDKDTDEMRKLKNHLARTNKDMREELISFIKQHSDLINNSAKYKKVDDMLNTLMLWGDEKLDDEGVEMEEAVEDQDDFLQKNQHNIADDNGYNSIQFIKNYLENFIKIFPNIILNEVDYDEIKVPKYWGLSGFHAEDVKTSIGDYYKDLRQFYKNPLLKNVLSAIGEQGKSLLLLGKETPYFTDVKGIDKTTHFLFDKRTASMLFEQYLLLTLLQYKYLAENESMVFDNDVAEEKLENVFDVDDLVTSLSTYAPVNILQKQSKMKQMKTAVSNLVLVYLQVMKKHKDIVSPSYKHIMDRVFKLQEREKNTFTDRLKALTDEERNVDNVLKANKLGAWGKGLQKGLLVYDADAYDDERDVMDKIAGVENMLLRRNGVKPDGFDLEDAMEDMAREEDIERDAYDMSFMNDDYDNGNFEADEVDDQNNYD
jgi:hypothetical protein